MTEDDVKHTRYSLTIPILGALLTVPALAVSGESLWEKAKEATSKGWEATKEGAEEAAEWTREKSSDALDATREGAAEAAEWSREKAEKAWHATREGAAGAIESLQGKGGDGPSDERSF